MAMMYRNASYIRRRFWIRRFLLTSLRLLLALEDCIQFVNYCKIILAILAVFLLTPFAIYTHLVLKVQKFVVETFFRLFYGELKVADSKSVRCALDTRSNPGIVTLVITLQGKILIDEIREQITKDILEKKVTSDSGFERTAFPHLKEVLAIKFGCYVWKEDINFDVSNHVVVAECEPITEANLQKYVGELCGRPMSDSRSPWQIVLIHLQSTDGKNIQSVLCIRAHHLVSEGLSFKELLQARVIDPAWTPSLNEHKLVFAIDSTTRKTIKQLTVILIDIVQNIKHKCDPQVPQKDLCSMWRLVRSIVTFIQNFLNEMQKLYEKTDPNSCGRSGWFRAVMFIYLMPRLLNKSDLVVFNISVVDSLIKLVLIFMATTPLKLCSWFWCILGKAFIALVTKSQNYLIIYYQLKEIVCEIGRTMKMITVAPSILVSVLVRRRSCRSSFISHSSSSCNWKNVSWSKPIPMEALQRIREVSGGTINEVLLSLCTGSMTQYFRLNGMDVPKCVMATVPVYSEGFFEAQQTGAEGLVPLSLPTGELDTHGRLTAVRKMLQGSEWDCCKYIISAYVLKYVRSFLPDFLIFLVVKYLTKHYPILLINVSLPSSEKLSFSGYEIKQLCYMRPPQANLALSLSLMTYNDHVTLVAMSDGNILPQPHVITEQFTKEFNSLALQLGVRRERHGTTTPYNSIPSNFSPFKL